jgi:hypothetical protein
MSVQRNLVYAKVLRLKDSYLNGSFKEISKVQYFVEYECYGYRITVKRNRYFLYRLQVKF